MNPVTITLWAIHHYLSRSRQSHDLQSSQGIDSKFSLKRRHTALWTILSALWFSGLCLQCCLYFWNMTIALHPPPPVNLPLGQRLSLLLGEQTAAWKPALASKPQIFQAPAVCLCTCHQVKLLLSFSLLLRPFLPRALPAHWQCAVGSSPMPKPDVHGLSLPGSLF